MKCIRWRAVAVFTALVLVLGAGAVFAGGGKESRAPSLEAGFRVTAPSVAKHGNRDVLLVVRLLSVTEKLNGLELPGDVYALFNLDIHGEDGEKMIELGPELKADVTMEIWRLPAGPPLVVLVYIGGTWQKLEKLTDYVARIDDSTAGRIKFTITKWPKDDVMVCLDG